MQRLPDLSSLKRLEDLEFISCKSLESIPDVDEKTRCYLHVDKCEHLDDYYGRYKKLKRKERKRIVGEAWDEAEEGDVSYWESGAWEE